MDVQTLKKPRAIFAAFLIAILVPTAACQSPAGIAPTQYDFVRVMWNDDPSTTATIGWSSSGSPATHQVYLDTADHGTDIAQYPTVQKVSSFNAPVQDAHAFVRLKGLKPKTKYYFVISDGKTTSKRYWFQTASDSPNDSLSIIAGGDSRNNRGPRQNANTLVAKLRPDAVMFGGDYTETGTPPEWRDWFADWQLTIAEDGRVTPLIVTRGNHELTNLILQSLFDAPSSNYYAMNLNGNLVRVYTLNSESSIAGSQTTWLKNDLARNQPVTTWQIAQYHTPMRPHVSSKKDGENQYKYWAPVFEQYDMDLVVECDSHDVKQTWPMRPSTEAGSTDGFIRDDAKGTVYVGEGGWGAPLRASDKPRPWTRDHASFNHVQWIWISQSGMEVRTIDTGDITGVESLTDQDRFRVPAHLNLWKPANGEVLQFTP